MLHRFLRRFNHYETLGVSYDANNLKIKQAFYKLAKQYHPDASSDQTADKFKEIAEAYKVLSDPELRSLYDRKLESGQIPPRKEGAPSNTEGDPSFDSVDPDESPYQKAYMNIYDIERRKKLREYRMNTHEHEKDPMYKKSLLDFGRNVGMFILAYGMMATAIISTYRNLHVPKDEYSLAKEIDDELKVVQSERNIASNIKQH